jgi:hypothetical protein
MRRRTPQSMPAADEDYFRDMDGAVALNREEVMGRNMWIVWTGGNDRFWDGISATSFGTLDFLKTVSSHPAMTTPKRYDRDNRFEYLGLVNEPCFRKATGPDPSRYGLWLDVRDPACPPDPFADAAKYPGIRIGARGTAYRRVASGDHPGRQGCACSRTRPSTRTPARSGTPTLLPRPQMPRVRDLIRPWVGMSCGFCHVGPDPIRPPADPEPALGGNLSSSVGGRYFWVDRIFSWKGDTNAKASSSSCSTTRPGSLDRHLFRATTSTTRAR